MSTLDERCDPAATAMAKQLLDALQGERAACPGVRLNHARGVLLQGIFTATGSAASLTTATHMQGDPVPVLVRFSSSTGLADVAENDAHANPRGIAVRFCLADGTTTDLVGHSVDGFPARTPMAFLQFLQAISGRLADPCAFDHYLEINPAAARFLKSIPSTPRSFVTERFSMLHGFVLTGPDNRQSIGRFHIRPVAGEDRLDPEAAAKQSSDFLTSEIVNRVSNGGCAINLVFQPATTHDYVDDISTGWPADRSDIRLGTIVLNQVAPEQDEQARILFDPARTTPGIAACGDPMLVVRSASYRAAFERRALAESTPAGKSQS